MSNRSTGEFDSRNGDRHGWVEYSRSDAEPPSVAVATALARYNDESATETNTQLYEHVDPDALDALFADRHDGSPRGAGRISFTIDDATVVVESDTVRVHSAPSR